MYCNYCFPRVKFRPSYFMFSVYFFFFWPRFLLCFRKVKFLLLIESHVLSFILLLPCPSRSPPHPFDSALVVSSLMWGVRREVSGPAGQWAPSLLSLPGSTLLTSGPTCLPGPGVSRLERGIGLGEKSTISPSPVLPANKTLLLQPHAHAHTHQATPVRVSDHL